MKRRTILAAVLAVLGLIAPHVQASDGCPQGAMDAFAFETITVSSTALPFTVATAFVAGTGPAEGALVTVLGDNVRFRLDGIVPTATVGHLVTAGQSIQVCGTLNARRFRMIRQTTDATVTVTYYRKGQ